MSGCRRLFGSAEKVGRTIKQRILEEVGLVASVGLAANKFLAKLASDLDKPDGFVVIAPDEARDLLASLPIGKLWGVGKVAEKQMHRFGIRKVARHAGHPAELAGRRSSGTTPPICWSWPSGMTSGRWFRCTRPNPSATRPPSTRTSATPSICRTSWTHLAAKVARRLRSHEFLARTVTLKARYPDFTTHTRSETLPSRQ